MYKLIAFVLALLALFEKSSASAEISDVSRMKMMYQLLKSGKECLKEYPLTKEDISIFNEFNLPDNDGARCFAACVFQSVGLIGEKGEYTVDTAIDNIKKIIDDKEDVEGISEFFQSCTSVNNKDVRDGKEGCDRAKFIHACLKEHAAEYGFDLTS